jgi:hypothetical protein
LAKQKKNKDAHEKDQENYCSPVEVGLTRMDFQHAREQALTAVVGGHMGLSRARQELAHSRCSLGAIQRGFPETLRTDSRHTLVGRYIGLGECSLERTEQE